MSYAAFLCVRIETGTETSCLISCSLSGMQTVNITSTMKITKVNNCITVISAGSLVWKCGYAVGRQKLAIGDACNHNILGTSIYSCD